MPKKSTSASTPPRTCRATRAACPAEQLLLVGRLPCERRPRWGVARYVSSRHRTEPRRERPDRPRPIPSWSGRGCHPRRGRRPLLDLLATFPRGSVRRRPSTEARCAPGRTLAGSARPPNSSPRPSRPWSCPRPSRRVSAVKPAKLEQRVVDDPESGDAHFLKHDRRRSLFTRPAQPRHPPRASRLYVAAVRATGGPRCLPPARLAHRTSHRDTLVADGQSDSLRRASRCTTSAILSLNVCIQLSLAAAKQIFRNINWRESEASAETWSASAAFIGGVRGSSPRR